MINIKYLDPNKIQIDENSFKNILTYQIKYQTKNSVKPLYLTTNKINEYIEERNENKYLTLVPTDKSKDTLKKYEELWTKIRYLIRSTSNDSDNYDKDYMKTKFNSEIKKILELYNVVTVVRSVFHEGNKCNLLTFLR